MPRRRRYGASSRQPAVRRDLGSRGQALAVVSLLMHIVALASIFQGWGSSQWIFADMTHQSSASLQLWFGANMFQQCTWREDPYRKHYECNRWFSSCQKDEDARRLRGRFPYSKSGKRHSSPGSTQEDEEQCTYETGLWYKATGLQLDSDLYFYYLVGSWSALVCLSFATITSVLSLPITLQPAICRRKFDAGGICCAQCSDRGASSCSLGSYQMLILAGSLQACGIALFIGFSTPWVQKNRNTYSSDLHYGPTSTFLISGSVLHVLSGLLLRLVAKKSVPNSTDSTHIVGTGMRNQLLTESAAAMAKQRCFACMITLLGVGAVGSGWGFFYAPVGCLTGFLGFILAFTVRQLVHHASKWPPAKSVRYAANISTLYIALLFSSTLGAVVHFVMGSYLLEQTDCFHAYKPAPFWPCGFGRASTAAAYFCCGLLLFSLFGICSAGTVTKKLHEVASMVSSNEGNLPVGPWVTLAPLRSEL